MLLTDFLFEKAAEYCREHDASDAKFFRFFRRSDPVFDERIPFVAVGTLPEQLGAAIAAPHADVWIHVEDRVLGQLDVPLHERALEVEV